MRAALVGLGMVSATYADAFRNSRTVSLARVFARGENGRSAFLKAHPDLGATEALSIEDVADDQEVDFVILTTPPDSRVTIVETLAEAGKPILMEKPIERTLEAATSLVELCEEMDVPLGIVLQHRARPVVRDLTERMPGLGPLIAVEVNIPWWRPQTYYDEHGRGTYSRDGGGVLITQAIHTIDLMLALTGPVEAVTAMCATTAFHEMEAEDFVTAGLSFTNGAVGQLFASTASFPGLGETITLHFAEGSARLAAGVLKIDRRDGASETFGKATSSGAGADPMAFTSDWHRAVIEDFAEALQTDRPPLVTGREALEVHKLIAAIERSGQTGSRTPLSDLSFD